MYSNFEFLSVYWPDLAQIGKTAESYLYSDPNACIYKIGLLSERIIHGIYNYEGLDLLEDTTQVNLISHLNAEGLLPKNIDNIVFNIRKARNKAVHTGNSSLEQAKIMLKLAFNLALWYMEVYGDWSYKAEEYVEPENVAIPNNYSEILKEYEDKINELICENNHIKTLASEKTTEERTKQSEEISEGIDFTKEEEEVLAADKIKMDVSIVPVINYALQQCRIPLISSIVITNLAEEIEAADLVIESSPEICFRFEKHIDYIPGERSISLKDINVLLNTEFLSSISEKVVGCITISLKIDDETIYSDMIEITALAFDEWHGFSIYPEVLSSFVMPNQPYLVPVVKNASKLLGEWTGDPSLDAYQTMNPNRVNLMAAAVYNAVMDLGITYVVPPASFSHIGQRIRLCDIVVDHRMGTCLDLTLFYASCLEHIGLNPLLILKPGHIFAGVWLEEKTFPESIQDDPSLITNRMAEGMKQIAVVECTALCEGKKQSFDSAQAIAESHFTDNAGITAFLDVKRSRLSNITPLPLRFHDEEGWHVEQAAINEVGLSASPNQIGPNMTFDNNSQMDPVTRKAIWERKLLDLGMRNTLINMRLTSSVIPLFAKSIDELEDRLSEGAEYIIDFRPSDWDIKVSEISFDNIHMLGANSKIIESEFKNNRLRTTLSETELTYALKKLYRTAKLSIEENGANTLYVAIGLLKWYENPKSTKARYAPLILVPVDLVRQSANRGYKIRLREDDVQINITLLEKLKQDFQIFIPGLDPVPMDDHGLDVRKIVNIIRKEIMYQPKWEVLESAYLGIFSFSQFVMWNDLKNRSEDLERNKIVRSLINNKLEWIPKRSILAPKEISEEDTYLPLPADASQLLAIQTASKGESFVLHGPPGTGKSQTITAMIANALANEKSVLFVAEKMAALEVVQKRLENIGLGQFCLELHSNKTNKKTFLEQLQQAAEARGTISSKEYAREAQKAAELRKELNKYVKELHRNLQYGLSIHDMVNEFEANSKYPDIDSFPYLLGDTLTTEQLSDMDVAVHGLISAAGLIGHPMNHPLMMVGSTVYSQRIRNDFKTVIKTYQKTLQDIYATVLRICDLFEEERPDRFEILKSWDSIAKQLLIWENFPRSWAETQTYEHIESIIECLRAAKEREEEISQYWLRGFFDQDGSKLLREWEISPKDIYNEKEEVRNALDNIITLASDRIEMDKMKDAIQVSWLESVYSLDGAVLYEAITMQPDMIWNLDLQIRKQASDIYEMAKLYIDAAGRKTSLLERWSEGYLSCDSERLISEINEANAKGLLTRSFAVNKVFKEVSSYAKSQDVKTNLSEEFRALSEYQKVIADAETLFKEYESVIRAIYGKREIDWKLVLTDADSAERGTERKLVVSMRTFSIMEQVKNHAKAELPLDALKYHLEQLKTYQTIEEEANQLLNLYERTLNRIYRFGSMQWDKILIDGKQAKEGTSGYLLRQIHHNNMMNTLQPVNRLSINGSDYREHFIKLMEYQRMMEEAKEKFSAYGSGLSFERLYQEKSYQEAILSDVTTAKQSYMQLSDITTGKKVLKLCGGISEYIETFQKYIGLYKEVIASKSVVDELLSLIPDVHADWVDNQIAECNSLVEHDFDVKEWITWRYAEKCALENGLKPVVDAYYSGVAHEDIFGAYRKGLTKALLVRAIDQNDVLNTFSGALFNDKIRKFKEIDENEMRLAQKEIFYKLAAKVPDLQYESFKNSEANTLQRAIKSKGRGLSIRKMFETMPTLIPRLCPCMLMSPISAAQYLDPNREPFDLVIFDEASQLTTAKAVGVLARGNNAVIVGDPKQMPPTSFFTSTKIDENNLDNEDLESILDDCLAINMPQTHLLWHYRSRHESLIEFSNTQFYENKLYTFPSVNDRESKVSLVMVDGYFERGHKRYNRAEAEAVVAEIVRRSKDEELRKYSVGVVTFNSSQQELIDDLLNEACAKSARLEKWVYQSAEPIFIKNLENVQGDERDVILFSIGYGPDENGKVSMNFGPLNRDGGWRRLNVAVSRSRYEMKVFSTLKPEKINLSATKAEGVVALKNFLLFAKQHTVIANEKQVNRKLIDSTGITSTISAFLREHGYDTEFAVGKSEYRVDVGVIDKRDPDKYLFGIILDGDSYKNCKTVRDREISQLNVLNDLGWDLIRIWSLDWWDNKEKELKRILDFAETQSEELTKRIQLKVEEGAAKVAEKELETSVESSDNVEDDLTDIISSGCEEENALVNEIENSSATKGHNSEGNEAEEIPAHSGSTDNQDTSNAEGYQEVVLQGLAGSVDAHAVSTEILAVADNTDADADANDTILEVKQIAIDLMLNAKEFSIHSIEKKEYVQANLDYEVVSPYVFLSENCMDKVKEKITSLILKEAPIHLDNMIDRILESYKANSKNEQLRNRIEECITGEGFIITDQGDDRYVWRKSQNPYNYYIVRTNTPEHVRKVEHICIEELENAILLTMLQNAFAFDYKTLVRFTAVTLGIKGDSPKVILYISKALDHLIEQKMIYISHNNRLHVEKNSKLYVRLPIAAVSGVYDPDFIEEKTVMIEQNSEETVKDITDAEIRENVSSQIQTKPETMATDLPKIKRIITEGKIVATNTKVIGRDNIIVAELPFVGTRVKNFFARYSIRTMADLERCNKKYDFTKIKNIGKTSLAELQAALAYDPNDKVFQKPGLCLMPIADAFSDRRFRLFVEYCEKEKLEYMYQLSGLDTKKLFSVPGLGQTKIADINKRYEELLENYEQLSFEFKTADTNQPSVKSGSSLGSSGNKLFENISDSISEMPVSALAVWDIKPSYITVLKQNGYSKIGDLRGITERSLLRIETQRGVESLLAIQHELEKPVNVTFLELIEKYRNTLDFRVLQEKEKGHTLQEIGDQIKLSRERVRQVIKNMSDIFAPLLEMMVMPKVVKAGYLTYADLISMCPSEEARNVVSYWLKTHACIEYLDYANAFIAKKNNSNISTENAIVNLLVKKVGAGINFAEKQKELEQLMTENGYPYMNIEAILALLQKNGYQMLGTFIVKA